MNIYKLLSYEGDIEKLAEDLRGSKKNSLLDMYWDYYDGYQWGVSENQVVKRLPYFKKTRSTRSGKIMWQDNANDKTSDGLDEGQLKVWNMVSMMIDTYRTYFRGDQNDEIELSSESGEVDSGYFGDLSEFCMKAVDDMMVSSVCVADARENGVRLINPAEIFPIYYEDEIVGMIRAYEITKEQAEFYQEDTEELEPFYVDMYYPQLTEDGELDENAPLIHAEYVGKKQINEENVKFHPYVLQKNRDHRRRQFDVEHVEISEVAKVVDIQDDINAYVTDLAMTQRYVAMPLRKLSDKIFEKALENGTITEDMDKIKGQLRGIAFTAGNLVGAPIENLESNPVADSSVKHLRDMLDQFYRETGIPRSVVNSEGLSQVATETVEHLLESLIKRVDEKRAKISEFIVDILEKRSLYNNETVPEDLKVVYPSVFKVSNIQQSKILVEGVTKMGLPNEYALEKLMNILGDAERVEEVLGVYEVENEQERTRLELMMRSNDRKANDQKRVKEKVESKESYGKSGIGNIISKIAKLG